MEIRGFFARTTGSILFSRLSALRAQSYKYHIFTAYTVGKLNGMSFPGTEPIGPRCLLQSWSLIHSTGLLELHEIQLYFNRLGPHSTHTMHMKQGCVAVTLHCYSHDTNKQKGNNKKSRFPVYSLVQQQNASTHIV